MHLVFYPVMLEITFHNKFHFSIFFRHEFEAAGSLSIKLKWEHSQNFSLAFPHWLPRHSWNKDFNWQWCISWIIFSFGCLVENRWLINQSTVIFPSVSDIILWNRSQSRLSLLCDTLKQNRYLSFLAKQFQPFYFVLANGCSRVNFLERR